jgi:hypothetical protein
MPGVQNQHDELALVWAGTFSFPLCAAACGIIAARR